MISRTQALDLLVFLLVPAIHVLTLSAVQDSEAQLRRRARRAGELLTAKETELEKAKEVSVDGKKAVWENVQRLPDIQKSRMELPVTMEEQRVVEAIRLNDIVVLVGETGSGKFLMRRCTCVWDVRRRGRG